MKKIKFLAIPVLAAMMFTGCASATPEATNKAPSVVGVKDVECMVNSTVDFLDGVAALDMEDGDITPDLKITVTPEVEVKDGYAHFTEVGEYTVNYSVQDSEGRTATKRAYVDVLDRETYKTFAMPEGFSAEAAGNAKITKCGMENRSFKLEATGGGIAEDIILTRTFEISETYDVTQGPCTFRYSVNSSAAGKIKIMADGKDCAELYVNQGDNQLEFMCTPKAVEEGQSYTIEIAICLGNLGDMNWTIGSVVCEYPQEANKQIERTQEFNFTGRTESRFDVKIGGVEGTDSGLKGNSWPDNGGEAAKLEVSETGTNTDIWLGGMFINTGISLRLGQTYKVTLNTVCKPYPVKEDNTRDSAENNYEILFKYKQWGPDEDIKDTTLFPKADGEYTQQFTITEAYVGSLWIYVQSGTQKNEITISDLHVTEILSASATDTYAIEDFSANGGNISTGNGNFTFDVTGFSNDGGATSVMSPSFLVEGSGANYVLTFKAKASKPIDMVVAIPVSGGWDPTILWQQVKLSEEETVYTFICNKNDADRRHTIAWQFGSASNTQYHDVQIEISDIRICLRNSQLDV